MWQNWKRFSWTGEGVAELGRVCQVRAFFRVWWGWRAWQDMAGYSRVGQCTAGSGRMSNGPFLVIKSLFHFILQ